MGKASSRSRLTQFVSRSAVAILSILTGLVYYLSNPRPQYYYDYTFRVAETLLTGKAGLSVPPPEYLNEFVPLDGVYYSVFPLGSVITMLPWALLKIAGVINGMPAALIAATCAAAGFAFLVKINERYELPDDRRFLMVVGIMFGTFLWTNLTIAGAWQLALGFAFVGELGAIYYTVFDRRPFIAGCFFALAFGNRTEVLLTAPLLLFLLAWNSKDEEEPESPTSRFRQFAYFCALPFLLGVLTLIYNYARFDSPLDFGYSRIPGVLDEAWYKHGIFSVRYMPRQAWEMLWRPWEFRDVFPFFVPNGFSSSIIWSSPFLLFALRFGSRDKVLKYAAWIAVVAITAVLWMHGNSGGWQFGYRYAIVLLPWLYLIMLESAPRKISTLEWSAYIFAFAANFYATWIFHFTEYPGRLGIAY